MDFKDTFLAFSVRSGGSTHDRISEIALVLVKEGEIIDKYFSEILPPPNPMYEVDFRQSTYEKSATLKEVWREIQPYFEQVEYVTAFNLSVHKSNLEKSLDTYGIALPSKKYFCAYNFAKENLPKVERHIYENVCSALNINTEQSKYYHLAQAIGVAEMIAKIATIANKSIVEYYDRKPSKDSVFRAIAGEADTSGLVYAEIENLSGATIVLTGDFVRYNNREDLAEDLKKRGAKVTSAISSLTTYVIIGSNGGPSKIQKIKDFQNKGSNVKAINEQTIYRFLDA